MSALDSNLMLWILFAIIVASLLFLDLFVFHKKSHEPKISETFKICASYVAVAVAFGLFVLYAKGTETGMLFFTGYLVEFSLSMDNIFVISLIFSSLKVPGKYQHRVLFWGVMGAVFMRAVMILLGASLVSNFHWVLYIFSGFLIYTGAHMLLAKEEEKPLEEKWIFKFISKHFNLHPKIEGEHFLIKKSGKYFITPLFFALLVIEMMDLIFAVDSIPAIFLITQDLFVIYTSNIFAILGLRSLYFLLAAAVNRFAYLKTALSVILIFIGAKIFTPHLGFEVGVGLSLSVTVALLAGGIAFSWIKTEKLGKKK